MTEQPRLPATIDGLLRFKWDDPDTAQALLRGLVGKRVNVLVTRYRETRTAEQNRALWRGVYTEAVAEGVELVEIATGQPVFKSAEDVHAWAKLNFLRRPVMTNRGELNLLGTTTTLTPEEFSSYIELVVAKLAQLGVYIPQGTR